MPKSVVINPFFDWHDDRPPHTPYHETVIYEAHVKGLTHLHPDVPEEMRGTYSGVAHPATIAHLQRLGITAIELMPVHQFIHDDALIQRGLRNYWGYNTVAFLAPHYGYATPTATGRPAPGAHVQEFKAMVRDLHAAGIEVILDVVYNHTAEGNHQGPTLSMRGIDNQAYYRLVEDDQRYYMDYTGTGNSLNVRHPHTLQLIMDSLRYWVTEMHVDGFRFDLASTLAREFYDVDRLSTFFDLVQQDPVISQVKLIAEPWDVGPGGYQVGNFPPGWTEWNGKYRDTVRDFWRGTPGTMGEFAARLTGSSDLYQDDGRRPYASINFVTAHDGFTLNDLVSYNEKHNEANGEGGQDGADDNNSWNHGVEGPTDDEAIRELRQRQRRNFLATLFLSQGVPMVLHGDEIGRTQYGNNNGYCQDSEISWMEWSPEKSDSELMDFTGRDLRAARLPPGVPAPALLQRAHDPPGRGRHRGPARHRLVHLVGRGDDRPGLGVRRGGRAHGVPQRRRHPRERLPRPARRRRLVHADLQRPLRGRRRHAPRQGLPAPLGRRARHHHRRGRRRHRPHDPDPGGAEPARGPPRARRGRRPHGHRAFDAAAAAHRPDGAVVSIPASTYRLQLSPAQDFAAARGLVGYLESLGVGALYCSPILQAAPGSTHGYDVVDPTRANDQLGGESGRRDLVATLRAAGLGVLVDLVPNHMGVAVPEANPSWWSLLRDGPGSEYASWYDADLVAAAPDPRARVARGRRRAGARRRASCATTSTATPSRPAPGRAPRRRCTSASTTGSCTGGAATPS